ncbi:MAG: hypothetical protein IPN21_18180 [Burkholderiales bacterium]|nr:hypothetical protein [Burkholderiales bacterium]
MATADEVAEPRNRRVEIGALSAPPLPPHAPIHHPASPRPRLAAGGRDAGVLGPPPLAKPFEYSIAQRAQACTFCHGEQGVPGPTASAPGRQKLAGYLHHQLLNFRDGRRHYGLMTRMVDVLSDAYLLEIAGCFAALDGPTRRRPAATPPPEPLLAPRARTGATAIRRCACRPACNVNGEGLTGALPRTGLAWPAAGLPDGAAGRLAHPAGAARTSRIAWPAWCGA